jgi:hypothetical protein
MLGLQSYGSSSDSDEAEGQVKEGDEFPEHLKPLTSDPSTSVASKMQIVSAPHVQVNVSTSNRN